MFKAEIDIFKSLQIVGASSSLIGSLFVWGGIKKKGELVKADNTKNTIIGWGFIIAGFIISLIIAIFQ